MPNQKATTGRLVSFNQPKTYCWIANVSGISGVSKYSMLYVQCNVMGVTCL